MTMNLGNFLVFSYSQTQSHANPRGWGYILIGSQGRQPKLAAAKDAKMLVKRTKARCCPSKLTVLARCCPSKLKYAKGIYALVLARTLCLIHPAQRLIHHSPPKSCASSCGRIGPSRSWSRAQGT